MRLILLIFAVLAIGACSNELDLIEDKKDIPIVYGFLSGTAETQYIRIERAFIDNNTSALELAKDPELLYYPSLEVEILNEETGDTYQLTRVEGDDEGFPREEGIFAQSPNYLYKVESSEMSLDAESRYTLRINRGEGFELVTATTNLVGEARFITPNPLSPTIRLDFTENTKTTFSWGQPDNAVLYDIYLDINFQERETGGTYEDRSLTWRLANSITDNRYRQDGRQFYTFMSENIEANPSLERRFTDFNIYVVASNNVLKDYIRVGQANLGITSTQDIPTFTNLSEGRGIFASRATSVFQGIRISPNTIDSLANGVITRDLNFRS